MRILWVSAPPDCKRSYAVQSVQLLPRLEKFGHVVAYHAVGMLQSAISRYGNWTVYPTQYNSPDGKAGGGNIVAAHARHFRADVVISLYDAWILSGFGESLRNWISYAPVASHVLGQQDLAALKGAYRAVAISESTRRTLQVGGVPCAAVIPHGVDTNIFMPRDKAEAKARLGFSPDDFVVGMVGLNQTANKGYSEGLAAMAAFKMRHPRAQLYLHTNLEGQESIVGYLQSLGFTPSDFRAVDQYDYFMGLCGPEHMAGVYNGLDVLLHPSGYETFGIPLIEAQACGVPVITTNFASMPELTFAGRCVDYFCQMAASGVPAVRPSAEGILEALEWAYHNRGSKAIAEKARAGAMRFDFDKIVMEEWQPFLNGVASELGITASLPARS